MPNGMILSHVTPSAFVPGVIWKRKPMSWVSWLPKAKRAMAIAATKAMCHHTDRSFMNATIRVPATLKPISIAMRMPVIQIAFRTPNVSRLGSTPNSGLRMVAHR